jgi:hypothetical protein
VATIYHQVWMNAPAARVYEAIARPESIGTWWGPQTAVRTSAGLVLEHSPGPEHGGVMRLHVLEMVAYRRIEWQCVSTHPRTSPASAWTGTRISFDVSVQTPPMWMAPGPGTAPKAVLDFRHSGWDEHSAYLGLCSFAWAEVLQGLRRVCESQRG